jgi:hypothetical protein
MAKWKVVDDKDVRNVWKCPDPEGEGCKETAMLSPDFYQESGEPLCPCCDVEMEYVRTEVKS